MRANVWFRTPFEAVVLAVVSALLALAVNAIRPAGLPLVARTPYEVLVPCPEPGGPVTGLDPLDPAMKEARVFLIDARERVAFERSRIPGAVSVPYDWLDPVPETDMRHLAREIAASRATRVVVYGDGGHPDSGEHLGREISGRGIRNVYFVRGGSPALNVGGPP
jgi:rhodanese-related sulfurtransferase